MQRLSGSEGRRVSRGQVARFAKAARYAAGGALAVIMGSSAAWAQCTNNGVNGAIPFAQGAAVSSIITTLGTVNTASLAQSTAFVGTPGNAPPDTQGGGNWSRVIAGTVETNSTTTTEGNFIGWSATDTCQTTTKQDFIGTQAGMDISRLNFANGGNIHFGATAGYFDIRSKDRTPGEGTFEGDTQVPFIGLYAQINSGNFSADAQLRGDYYHSDLSDPAQGMFGQSLDAKGAAFLWNASYQFDVAKNWFIRPSVGGIWSRTEVDKINVAGGLFVPPQVTLSTSFPGTVEISPITTLLGRASLTAGGTIVSGNYALQPFFTVSVFHEFAGDVTANMADFTGQLVGGVPLFGSASSTTSRVGTYAHIGLGVAGTIVDTGWLGYAKIDFLTGDNIEAASINAGLRYQFNPTASASMKDGGSPAAAPFNWTGLYAGWMTGGVIGEGDWADALGSSQPRFSGYLTGGTLGYNQQIGHHLVIGVEADAAFSNAKGGRECSGGIDTFFFSCEVKQNSLSTLTGRLGLARERALFYVKGGLAVGETEARTKDNLAGLVPAFAGGREDSKVLTGWTLGIGMEYAITDRWTAKAEYLHYDLGKATYDVFDNGVLALPAEIDFKGDTVRIGVNYHFGHRGADYDYEALK